MRRLVCSVIAVGLLWNGCGAKPKPAAPATPVAENTSVEPEASSGEVIARLFRRDAADGESVGPSLEVIAPSATEPEPRVMHFGDVQVTIFGDDDQRTVMVAKKGVLDQNKETAVLSEEVVVTMGTQTITTNHLDWNNEQREAIARDGVRIVDGDTALNAEAMRFSPDENTLTLERVTGVIHLPKTDVNSEARIGRRLWRTVAMWLVMAAPVHAQAGGDTVYTQVAIEKPAPRVVFRDNRLDQMTGGVEIQLKTANENDPGMVLAADTISFAWTEGASTELASLAMSGSVSVANSEGNIRSAEAQFDVAHMTITFGGGVNGRFEGIDEFQANRLTYQIESGDMEMRNLKATIPFGDNQGGDAGSFSQMDVTRAAIVRISGGKVRDMSGGVDMRLTPREQNARPISLQADTFGFTYADADQRQPNRVVMTGAVRVDAPQGLIQSDKADFDVSGGELKFRGNVRGRSNELKSFRANSFDYDLDTEDGLLRSFSADGVQLGNGDGGYDRMDVRRAKEVHMRRGRVTEMSGGVTIYLAGDDERAPLDLDADSVDIAYDSSEAPSSVKMKGDVHVATGETDVRSDIADLNMETETIDFTGNFRADIPRAKGVTGTTASFDLNTGNMKLYGHVPEILPEEPAESADRS